MGLLDFLKGRKTKDGKDPEISDKEPDIFVSPASDCEENLNTVSNHEKRAIPHYDKTDRNHMRRLLQKASPIIDLIAEDRVPFGTQLSVELIDLAADSIGHENEKQKDDDELQELKDDRYSIINLYGAVKKEPAFVPLYVQLGNLLRKYGLFDEEVVLLEKAVSDSDFSNADLVFAFRKPKDLTLQDRFLVEIMKNNPDRTIREHVRTELLSGNIEIPGVDLTKPDPFFDK